ncbi:SCO family protein [Rhodohalobacter barkolensis]|uniref:SCO family protein n=1 Tax=Rhodohalobacter barkolensis TaxID=2053187 RepID=A0A2N0VJ37_9BACT|nr:SCO family protein [Rhodohalobacter barkolensis]PKD44202.1 SCO family protein [Rhodohalobacter barkolensis]
MKYTLRIAIWVSVFFIFSAGSVSAQLNQSKPQILEDIGVDEKLGDNIPLDLKFANSEGDSVRLGDLLESGKPVLLNPLYYECPTLCSLVLDAVYKVVDQLVWSPGDDYTIISFSIDPEEGPDLAAQNKRSYLESLDRPNADEGWHFLTGNQQNIEALTESIGFKYKYDEETGEYLHLASIMLLSPEGKITRYLYGATFRELDLRNALHESADGKIGSAIDQVVLYCFTYDPSSQSYVPVAMNIMKLGGLATVIILGIFLGIFWRRERRSTQSSKITTENE